MKPGIPSVVIKSLATLALLSSISQAGVIRHDVNDLLYTNLANQSKYGSVGFLSVAGLGSCSGNLIASNWVLTAAHCVSSTTVTITGITFGIDGNSYTASNWFAHEDWTEDLFAGNDLGLIHLSTGITGVSFANLYSGNAEVGATATYVGYGTTGTGITGNTSPGGTLRAGENIIDVDGSAFTSAAMSPNILLSDFDHLSGTYLPQSSDITLGSTMPLALEYLTASGDSGGGAFIDVGPNTFLVGVNSFVGHSDGTPNSDYEDISGVTRVSAYVDWINENINPVPVPAASSLLLMLTGLTMIVRRRRSI